MMNTTTARILKVATALLLAVGAVTAVPMSASAATATSFCVRWPSGGVHYGEPYANQPVSLVNYSTGALIKTGSTNAAGCGTFYGVPSNLNVWVKVNRVYGNGTIGMAIFHGGTPRYATPGAGTANLGTMYLRQLCTQGTMGYCAALN
jgi:hypothetical protein